MNTVFYIAAKSDDETGGIYGFDENHNRTFFLPRKGLTYLAYSPDRTILYTVFRDPAFEGVGCYRRAADGSLEPVRELPTCGRASCHITGDARNEFFYCANYLSGDLIEYRLKNGLLDGEGRLITHDGKLGPNSRRQEHTHAHNTVFTPDGKYLCLVDLGLDEVLLYPFTPGKGLSDEPSFRYRTYPGAGPRHILFAPSGKSAWLANEVDSTVSVLDYADGKLTHRVSLPVLPPDYGEKALNTVAAIRLSPNGRHLVVSSRGHDSFACFHVAEDDSLALYDIVSTVGRGPRDVNFLPDGSSFCSCNERTNDVTFFHYDHVSGRFTATEHVEQMPDPLCVI